MSLESSPTPSDALGGWLANNYSYALGVAYRRLWVKAQAVSSPESAVHSAATSLLQKHGEEVINAAAAGKLGELLIKAIARHCDKRNKRAKRRREVPLEAGHEGLARAGPASEEEYEQALENLYCRLTPQQCAVLAALLAGVPRKEIAARLGVSEATVSRELKRTRQLLAEE